MQDALQGAHGQGAMQGHGHTLAGFHQPDVRAALAGNRKAAPLKSLNNRSSGKITGELHTGTRIGSLMKWIRIRWGVSSSPK